MAAADTAVPDGDAVASSPNLIYGANDCDDMGTPVGGKVVVNYAGSTHFVPGEPVSISYNPSAGISVGNTGGATNVPLNWNDNGDLFTITFDTTVAPGSAGGSVEMDITGGTSGYVAGTASSGKPKFNVNVHVDCVVTVPPDTTDPTISLTHGTPTGNSPWFTSDPVTVTITAADNVAVTSINCTDSVDGGTPNSIAVNPDSTLTVTGDGVHALSCTASDAAGNTATGTDTVYIDTTIPGISGPTVTPTTGGTDLGGNFWHNTGVTLTWDCSDATSGPASATNVQTLPNEGAAQTATGTCTDNAGNTSTDGSDPVNIDTTAPALNITGAPSGAYDVCTAPTRPSFAPTDNLSGVASSNDTWTAAGPVGTWTYFAQANDYATNHAEETRTYTVTYGAAFGGVLQPVNADGSSRFKLGSTVPVKFRLTCNGVPITNATATLRVTQGDSSPDPGEQEVASTSAATTGNLFRYSDGQYIFNLATKPGFKNPNGTAVTFSPGTWTLSINLDDGTFRNVKIQLVK